MKMENLPDIAKLQIFSFLPVRDICRLQIVCKNWSELLQDFSLWTEICINYDNDLASIITDEMLSSWLFRWGSHVKTLRLRFCRRLTNFIGHVIAYNCPQLEFIDLQGCIGIGDYGIAQVAEGCCFLKKVNLFMTGITEVGCLELVNSVKVVSSIKLPSKGNCCLSLNAICSNCITLETLILNDIIPFDETEPVVNDLTMTKVAETFTMIRKMSLNWCWYLTDDGMRAIAEHCKNMEHLVVRECHQISDEGLIEIVRMCPKLRKLQLGRLYSVTDRLADGFKDKKTSLTRLKLIDTSMTDSGISRILEHSPELVSLFVGEYCMSAKRITGEVTFACAKFCKKLSELVIVSSKSINDEMILKLAKNLTRLNTLLLGSCFNVTAVGLNAIVNYCKSLRKLRVCECDKFDNVILLNIAESSLALRSIEIYGCSEITKEGLRTFEKKKPSCRVRI